MCLPMPAQSLALAMTPVLESMLVVVMGLWAVLLHKQECQLKCADVTDVISMLPIVFLPYLAQRWFGIATVAAEQLSLFNAGTKLGLAPTS